ncbi:unnamed protein product, partial [Nesidiocoris tenuis]
AYLHIEGVPPHPGCTSTSWAYLHFQGLEYQQFSYEDSVFSLIPTPDLLISIVVSKGQSPTSDTMTTSDNKLTNLKGKAFLTILNC